MNESKEGQPPPSSGLEDVKFETKAPVLEGDMMDMISRQVNRMVAAYKQNNILDLGLMSNIIFTVKCHKPGGNNEFFIWNHEMESLERVHCAYFIGTEAYLCPTSEQGEK